MRNTRFVAAMAATLIAGLVLGAVGVSAGVAKTDTTKSMPNVTVSAIPDAGSGPVSGKADSPQASGADLLEEQAASAVGQSPLGSGAQQDAAAPIPAPGTSASSDGTTARSPQIAAGVQKADQPIRS